jgi:hypothetical protein
MLLRCMMEGKIIVETVDLLTVLMIVLVSLDGRLVAPGGARSSMPKKGWSEQSAGRQCVQIAARARHWKRMAIIGVGLADTYALQADQTPARGVDGRWPR